MNRNIKYKQVTRLSLFGDDDVNTTTNSQYIVYPSKVNGITINNAGTNYIDANTQLNIVGGGGSGAVATATTSSGAISTQGSHPGGGKRDRLLWHSRKKEPSESSARRAGSARPPT